jgi:phosphopantetheine adenylyltransferase/dephospho-CoA kinase
MPSLNKGMCYYFYANPLFPRRPYIIGLTSNNASGKSSVGQRLENLRGGLINCDILAHSVYRKGEPCYESIVQHFGKEILDGGGEVNRKALGESVFNYQVYKLEYSR